MYATIPEDAEAKQPKNQAPARRGFGLVVALCVGVMIGALGTMALVAGGPEAPSPSRAAMELDAQSHGCSDENIDSFTSCCEKAKHALACALASHAFNIWEVVPTSADRRTGNEPKARLLRHPSSPP